MDLDKIQRLLEIVAESGLDEVKVEEGDFKLTVRATARPTAAPAAPMMMAAPAAAPAPAAPAAAPASAPPSAAPAAEPGSGANESVVLAPIVGTFYEAPSPDAAAFVSVGQRVEVGQTLCIIEAMKLMNEIQAEEAGTITQILAKNAEPVEYDQPLFVIEK
ncbi:acetyl-CoA carboxylase, biotin carboxyl carrier protein [Rubrivirga sp. SAORIC476]|uniref:acetyl-CoA carboxylase biotin carboxyl carrier protein n=1 Tax=Rubrivirga sp. SAORIC476 TaxID=1961794 RepID=UPI000BA97315|nr:acetyl-CoA carboxylase biotin carboxyl carrier protein [Rubrivirga sp. SAORIC476]PAP81882.1 acetyl-CoA carboxylase, biotin carboxyl carrier protein [Rubrivirga sp. SAORIC476]